MFFESTAKTGLKDIGKISSSNTRTSSGSYTFFISSFNLIILLFSKSIIAHFQQKQD